MRVILFVLLAADGVQLVAGLAGYSRGRRSSRAGAPSHARYSAAQGTLLVSGALFLAVPVLLGLLTVISTNVAVYVAVALALLSFPVARAAVKRFEAAHQARRPVASRTG